MKTGLGISIAALSLLCGCASPGPSSVSIEHKGKTTVIHHRRRVSNGSVDHIEAVSASGIVSQADIKVYDVGRLPDGRGGVIEAHREYRVVQDSRIKLNLPKRVSSGPRTVYTPPNYEPMSADQRINDAVDEAKRAKDKLLQAEIDVQKRLQTDNNLKGELETEVSKNQELTDKLNAAMATPHKVDQTDAQKVAPASITDLQKWGQNQSNQQ